jgi:4'-phosphopantetheinyl transferase EntD
VIEAILPPAAQYAEAFGERLDPPYAQELALVGRAVESRRREFATARACAREALGRLGVAPVAILADARGAPRWPLGVVGSISHCRDYRACAVARSSEIAALGIDAERNEPVGATVRERITLPRERAQLAALSRAPARVCWDRLIFCAKECAYKAHYQLSPQPLGYVSAEVTIDAARGTFDVALLVPTASAVRRFPGRWCERDGLLLAVVAIERSPRA